MLGPGRSKEARALGVVPGKRPRCSKGFGLAHELHPLACLAQAGGSDLAGCFQASEQDAFLSRAHSASAPHRQRRACAWEHRQRFGSGQAWVPRAAASKTIVLVLMRAHYARSSNTGRRRPFIPRLKLGGIRVSSLVSKRVVFIFQPKMFVSLNTINSSIFKPGIIMRSKCPARRVYTPVGRWTEQGHIHLIVISICHNAIV